ncbi:MAG: hypothetical protein OEZ58_00165 [Gammaproteobacteria bacterium]|nr:hypothetical protein [Gammaproteobacteria bacterium]
MNRHQEEAYFSGKNFFKSGKFLIENVVDIGVQLTSTYSYMIDGSFILERENDFLFVDGRTSGPVRWMLIDSSPERQQNADSLIALGVPMVSISEARINIDQADVPLLNITEHR